MGATPTRICNTTLEVKQAMTYQSLNPATGKLLKKFDELTNKELETKIVTAATCFETWRKKTYGERAVIVAKAAAILHANANQFAHTMTLEMGKRIGEASPASCSSSRPASPGRTCPPNSAAAAARPAGTI